MQLKTIDRVTSISPEDFKNNYYDKKKELQNIHPHVAVLTILSAVRGLEFWQRHKKELSIEVLENNIVNHLLHGLIK